jgi:hypothetical protein
VDKTLETDAELAKSSKCCIFNVLDGDGVSCIDACNVSSARI